MQITTCNIGRGESPGSARANMKRVISHGGIICWQEIDEADGPDEHAILKSLLGKDCDIAGWSTMSPITIPRPWRLVHERTVKGCDGKAGYTPNRPIVVAVVENEKRPHIGHQSILCWHSPINRSAVEHLRQQVEDAVRHEIVVELAAGRNVAWGADVNDTGYPSMHPGERTLVHSGLDWVRWNHAKGAATFHQSARGAVNLTVDGHDAHWAKGHLSMPEHHGPKHSLKSV